MSFRSNIVYRYDGSFPGFLCCVAACFENKAMPSSIQLLDHEQATLFPIKEVITSEKLAARVESSIPKKISPLAYEMVRNGFLSCMEEKEMVLLRFILLGYKYGARVTRLETEPHVHALNKALLYLKNEAHYHLEFLRFSDCGGFLAAEITPNNVVLPLIVNHFCDRFSVENFMIFDKNHHMGFLHEKDGRREFFHADNIQLPEPDEEEENYRRLWQHFYDSIAIEGRKNPKLRRNNMPMRYWDNMTEFQRDRRNV